jgi:ATP-dependent RNA helicase DeaD
MSSESPPAGFHALGLSDPVLRALDELGYETPSPIQSRIIPHMLAGDDVIGQAQTGTGKTAAFALPLLTRLGEQPPGAPGVLVLTPTRELAIQVSEAFQRYAAHLPNFHVLPIYGGQDYRSQLRALRRGVQVIVGTPGRVIDHLGRGTLNLGELACVVLDEADEMLRMGFIEDVEKILEQTPDGCQAALFSATMPPAIRRIAQRHLHDPAEVTVQVRTASVDTIRQRAVVVAAPDKLEALTRLLEAETGDGLIVFVRTKTATGELAEKLKARGYEAAPLNGDIPQSQREFTVEQLRSGNLDVLVATDVAARGLDVPRISHVINYDIPHDTETYIHRIGRTGRAGRKGEAILFVTPREKRLLQVIGKATGQRIEIMPLPSADVINAQRISRFKQRIGDTLAAGEPRFFRELIEQYQQESGAEPLAIAAALASMVQGEEPLLLVDKPVRRDSRPERAEGGAPGPEREARSKRARPAAERVAEPGMERFRIEVGHQHGVKPGNIVGAIANEAGLDSKHIGRIDIRQDHSFVDLPEGMPRELLNHLKKIRVMGVPIRIARMRD